MNSKTKDNLKDRSVYKIPRSSAEDTVNETFKIHLGEEIIELSNEFCKYYNATHTEIGEEYFAIIYENNFLYSISNIDLLCKNPVDHVNTIYDYSIVTLSTSKEEHLAIIINRYNPSDNLANYLAKGNSFKPTAIMDFISKFINIFSDLNDIGIYGYNVNPKNILMRDGEFFGLKEFINAYPNFYQEQQYLAPEIAECHPAGRYVANIKSDIYALGVSMFEAYSAKQIWNEHKNIQEYNLARFENTTSKYLLSKIRAPEKWRVFFKWSMHDEANVRWNIEHAKDWLTGKITKAGHESLSDSKNTVAFMDANYSSLKSLSYALFNNWTEAVKYLKDNKLFKWAIREQLDPDTLEQIKFIVEYKKPETYVMSGTNVTNNNKILKLLSLLDPNGSIRFENIAFSAASIHFLLHYLVVYNKRDIVEKIIKLIKDDPWLPYQKNPDSAGYLDPARADIYKQLAANIFAGSIVKGPERLIYSLNVNAPCQSHSLKGKYIANILELVRALDLYTQKNPTKLNIDKNIVAFIAAKLGIADDIRPVVLANFPKFADHPVIRSLTIFNIIEQHEPGIKAIHVNSAIIKELKELFEEHIHNIEFRKKIIQQIDNCSNDGNLNKVIAILSDQQQFINDYNGYYEACRKVKVIEEKIKVLCNEDKIFNGALLLGQKVTVLVSYVICFIVTLYVL